MGRRRDKETSTYDDVGSIVGESVNIEGENDGVMEGNNVGGSLSVDGASLGMVGIPLGNVLGFTLAPVG